MQLTSLNTWGGRRYDALADFVARTSHSVDIYCFQEVFNNAVHVEAGSAGILPEPDLYKKLQALLPEHRGYFQTSYKDDYGLATFVRTSLSVAAEHVTVVYREKGYVPPPDATWDHPRIAHTLSIDHENGMLHICNFHGTSGGGSKEDSPERLVQSQRLLKHLNSLNGKVVLCGDFNVTPATKSLSLLEAFPLRNLVREYGIESTRSALYTKTPHVVDYVLVSQNITVHDVAVPEETVSDHVPLVVDLE